MQMLPRSRPENLDDLTVQVALVRPGPIQGGAVHPYLERKKALREDPGYVVPYEHPCAGADPLRHARRDRLPGSGDPGGDGAGRLQLRRGRGAAAGDEPQALRRGAARLPRPLRRGGGRPTASTLEVAERVFDQIKGFSGFGFPKSHAAAFGLLAYQSTWLRVHYGPEFLCALLNEQPMGFYPPDALVHEAQRRGIEVLGPDVNASAVECTVEAGDDLAVRIGLGLRQGAEGARRARSSSPSASAAVPTRDLGELASRSGASRDALERLAWAGACAGLGGSGGATGGGSRSGGSGSPAAPRGPAAATARPAAGGARRPGAWPSRRPGSG